MKPTVTHFQSYTNRTMKPSGPHIWEMSGVPVHVFSSLSKFSSRLCCFLQEKPAERGISASFLFFFQNPSSAGFSLGEKPATPQRSTKLSRRGVTVYAAGKGPSLGQVGFYGHVLTVQNSHEECLLKSWRLNRK